MLRHGVSFHDLNSLCKKIYVAVATDEFGVDGRPTNVSRVAILTGMTRRDVRKIRLSLDDREQEVLGRMNSATRVLSGWYQDADFLDDAGNPLPLPESGPNPSFSELAKRFAGDIPVTTLLKELRNAGAAGAGTVSRPLRRLAGLPAGDADHVARGPSVRRPGCPRRARFGPRQRDDGPRPVARRIRTRQAHPAGQYGGSER